MKRTLITIAAAAAAFVATAAWANPQAEAILHTLKAKYPATTFTAVRPTPIPGIFEVQMGRNLAYTDDVGRNFLFGAMYDMESRQDLTAARKAELGIQDAPAPQQRRAEAPPSINWADLPLADAFVRVKGKGERKLAVFSDPDCPFCRQLERELEKLDNVTIYTFLYPLAGLHPNAPAKSESIWCAGEKGRNKVWLDQMIGGKTPAVKSCDNPVGRNGALGDSLGVRGTPTMFAADGRRASGAMPVARIEAFLSEVKQ